MGPRVESEAKIGCQKQPEEHDTPDQGPLLAFTFGRTQVGDLLLKVAHGGFEAHQTRIDSGL